LGIARTTVVLGRTQAESCAMVTPVRMLMSNLPFKASLIPLSLRTGNAPCGLQLNFYIFSFILFYILVEGEAYWGMHAMRQRK
jgi:hypothetical protein